MWYNQIRKNEFIKERRSSAEISNNINNYFDSTEFFEESYGRDLCDWTSAEIVSWLKYLSTPRIQSLVACVNTLRIYVDWCLNHLMVQDGQNHFYEITTEILCECVDINKLSELVIKTRDDMISAVYSLPNACDQFVFLGLYEGMSRDALLDSKISDFNDEDNIITVNEHVYHISSELKGIIYAANSEDTYESMKETKRAYQLDMSDSHIIKTILSKRANKNRNALLNNRLIRCREFLGWNEQLSTKDIQESGRLDLIRHLMKEKSLTFDEMLSIKWRKLHEDIYGKIQNVTSYKFTYGRFI